MTTISYLPKLRQKIIELFNEEELRTLCFDLGVDYDSLAGREKSSKARELLAKISRDNRLSELIPLCYKYRPNANWPYRARIFIAYKRHVSADSQLAHYLYQSLSQQGFFVFIDKTMRTGMKWLEEIDKQIKASDFFVLLLSRESADSEMIQAETRRAYSYRKEQGHPQILPIRMAYEGLLPYAIDISINPLQYVVWQDKSDNDRIVMDVIAAIDGDLPDKPLITPSPIKILGTDGNIFTDKKSLNSPLPQYDPRSLRAPGGAIHPNDKLYIRRKADVILEKEITQKGVTITIRASRQMGKTSLLMRGLHHAVRQGARTVFFDIQNLGDHSLKSPNAFLKEFAACICRDLGLNTTALEKDWADSLSPQKEITYFLEDHVLSAFEQPIILAIDEADALLDTTTFYRDFFGMLRSWHNRRALYEPWEKLSIILVISTEPYLLIDNINQSPFNVGLTLELQDFTPEQVAQLFLQHGKQVNDKRLSGVMNLLNGHPFLTRQLLYKLATHTLTDNIYDDNGPFGSHLRRLYWTINKQPALQVALKQIIKTNHCQDERMLYRLLSAGLVKGSGNIYYCRCKLYQRYFEAKLK